MCKANVNAPCVIDELPVDGFFIPLAETPETAKKYTLPETAFISKSNGKTGILSFNMLAGNENHPYNGSIPHDTPEELREVHGSCNCDCPGCYAKAMTRYTKCMIHYAENTLLSVADPVRLMESIELQLFNNPLTAPRVFRFHDSGDFITYDYFVAVMDFIKRHPETRFGAYTKRSEFCTRYGLENLPENLSLQCSPWEGVCEPIGDLPQFIYDDGTNPEYKTLPHCPAVDKNGKRTGVQCINCLHCYTSKRGDKWAVYAH